MTQNSDSFLNESRASHITKTSGEKEYHDLNFLINNIRYDDKTNSTIITLPTVVSAISALSIPKVDKSNSMLSNQDIWNAENNNNDDSKLFYQKIEEFQKGNYPKKPKISYFEDYNDDVDESVVLVKIDQIHQIANNEFKQNNLKEINASKSGNEKAEGFVSPSHNTCSTLTSPVSDETTNALLCSIDKAKYFTPKCLKVSGNNEIMSLNCIKKELNFNSITNGNANSSGNGNGTTNNGVIANRTTSPSPWQNSKKTFVVPSSKFDLPFGNTHLVIGNNNTNQGYSNYTNGKSYSFIGKPKGKDSNNINPIGTASFPTGTQPEVTSKKINLENIIIGSDKRTTLMLRNIPNKYTLSNILEEISHSFWAKYDYINLPIDYERKLNLGYAFINFSDPLHIVLFYETYRFKKWSKYKSDKKMDMNYADKQGKKDVNSKDTQSYFLEEDKRFNHVVLQPKIEIPVTYLDFFKKIYPNSVCVVEDKCGIYNDKCFIVKNLGKK